MRSNRIAALVAMMSASGPALASTEVDMDSAMGGFFLMVLGLYVGGAFVLALILHLFMRWRWWTLAIATSVLPLWLWLAMSSAFPHGRGLSLATIGAFATVIAGGMATGLIGAVPGAIAGAAIRKRMARLLGRKG